MGGMGKAMAISGLLQGGPARVTAAVLRQQWRNTDIESNAGDRVEWLQEIGKQCPSPTLGVRS